ncbi:hypothetical protein [Burkholderia anthina]|uniref:hypothetical protein n=1 Tax=Burkholderia anthina TaxID=179879 RepID=UPI00075ACA7F|nr:hypothetical protein [Burkholderia anthina]KWH62442.1 hypothetical protein WT63_13570 [Burkholderia anthina]
MAFQKVTKPSHYIVQLDAAGAVDAVSLRTIEHVVDSDTGAAVSDVTIVPIVDFSNGGDTAAARVGLVALRALIDAAIARSGA